MTNIKFFRKNGKLVGVEASGHTGYAEQGEDIVCAAASSIIQTAVLGLMQLLGIAVSYEVNADKGYLKVALPSVVSSEQSHDADIILRTAYLGVSDLYEEYSDYITLEVE